MDDKNNLIILSIVVIILNIILALVFGWVFNILLISIGVISDISFKIIFITSVLFILKNIKIDIRYKRK